MAEIQPDNGRRMYSKSSRSAVAAFQAGCQQCHECWCAHEAGSPTMRAHCEAMTLPHHLC